MQIKIGYRKPGMLMGKPCGINREDINRLVWALFQMPLFISGRPGPFFVFLLVYVIGDFS